VASIDRMSLLELLRKSGIDGDVDLLRAYPKTIISSRKTVEHVEFLQEKHLEEIVMANAPKQLFSIPDELWEKIQPLLPEEPPKPKGGRPRMDDRQAMTAIFYVLRTGIQWKALPRQMGAASTVHDRFQYWQEQGVFKRMWEAGLQAYDEAKGIEWTWQAVDGAMTKAPLGGKKDGS